MIDQNGSQQSRAELEGGALRSNEYNESPCIATIGDASAYLGFTFGLGGEPRLKLLVQRGDLLDGGFLGRNTGHLEFQLSDVLARLGGDGLDKFEVIFPGKYVGDDVWSVKDNPLGGGVPARREVDANDANIFAGEGLTTERAGGGETRGRLGNDLFATV